MSSVFETFSEMDELAEQLADADPGVRHVAVLELGECSEPEAIELLAAAIKDSDAGVRQQAAIPIPF